MARITFFKALGDLGFAVSFYDQDSLVITDHTETTATMTDAKGARVDFVGTGLMIDKDGAIAGGTITAITLTSASGDVLTTVTGLHKKALVLWDKFITDGLFGVEFDLIKGDDKIIGSSVGDYMFGLTGNDLLEGHAGKDAFAGGVGSDTMTGGKGADFFVFGSFDKHGHDVITDFHASGPKSARDKISISTENFAGMTFEKDGNDVLIHWAWGADLRLSQVDITKFDVNDFNIV